jgi:hypothetical protein
MRRSVDDKDLSYILCDSLFLQVTMPGAQFVLGQTEHFQA